MASELASNGSRKTHRSLRDLNRTVVFFSMDRFAEAVKAERREELRKRRAEKKAAQAAAK